MSKYEVLSVNLTLFALNMASCLPKNLINKNTGLANSNQYWSIITSNYVLPLWRAYGNVNIQ